MAEVWRFNVIKITEGTAIKAAKTTLDVKHSRLKIRMLSNIENISDAATIGTTAVIFPVSKAVLKDMIAVLMMMPDKINQ